LKKIIGKITQIFDNRLIKIVFTIIIFVAVYYQFNKLNSNLSDIFVIIRPHFFLFALPFVIFSLLFHVIAWRIIVNGLGANVEFSSSVFIYYFSALSRYLPGNYWYIFSRSVIGQEKGLDLKTSFAGTGIELIINTIVALLFSLVGGIFGFSLDKKQFAWIFIILILSLLLFFLIMIRKSENKIHDGNLSFLEKIRNKINEVTLNVSLPKKNYLFLFILYASAWFTQGFSFFFVLSGWELINLDQLPIILFAYVTGWVIGFLNPLSPNGLGTREAIFLVMLSHIIPVPTIIGASVIMRLLGLIGELLFVFISWIYSIRVKTQFQ